VVTYHRHILSNYGNATQRRVNARCEAMRDCPARRASVYCNLGEIMTPQLVEELLPEMVRRLQAALNPTVIYLFGSCAYGAVGPDSDIDLLVVVPRSSLSFFERGAAAYRALRGIGVPVDVQVYTREEFEARAALPVSFERTVRTKGRILYAA
jgi:predicted nucleotidyltransferase